MLRNERSISCVVMSQAPGPAFTCESNTRGQIRTNLPTKQKAAEPEPQKRLRCNSPLRSERHLFPGNGSISGFEKVIWKHGHAHTHSYTTQSMAVNHSGFSWYTKSQKASSVAEKKKKKSYCNVQKGRTRLFQIRTWHPPFLLTFNLASP